jgi:hypothetical protein
MVRAEQSSAASHRLALKWKPSQGSPFKVFDVDAS